MTYFLFIEFVAKCGCNIYLIDDFNYPFRSLNFGYVANDNTVNQLIAHFPCKFGRVDMLLDIPYKVIHVLPCGFRFAYFSLKLVNIRRKRFLLGGILLYKAIQISSGILPFTLSS